MYHRVLGSVLPGSDIDSRFDNMVAEPLTSGAVGTCIRVRSDLFARDSVCSIQIHAKEDLERCFVTVGKGFSLQA